MFGMIGCQWAHLFFPFPNGTNLSVKYLSVVPQHPWLKACGKMRQQVSNSSPLTQPIVPEATVHVNFLTTAGLILLRF